MIKRILVPLDGTPLAETALSHAVVLARKTKAALYLVRIAQARRGMHILENELACLEEAQTYIDSVAAGLFGEGIKIYAQVRYGRVIEQILDYAALIKADLIVMATHGRTGLPRLFIGSVSERVVREAECPVLLIHDIPVQPSYKHIVVLLDQTPFGETVLPLAAQLAQAHAAHLVLLSVLPPPALLKNILKSPDAREEEATGAVEKIEEGLALIAESLWNSGVMVETICRVGDAKTVMEEYVQEMDPDLIMVATRSRSPFDLISFDRIAGYALHHSTIPVLLYHYQGLAVSDAQDYPVANGRMKKIG